MKRKNPAAVALSDADMINAIPKHTAAVALGSRGGSSKSEAKAKAARENGKKGGRPLSCKAGCDIKFTSYAEKSEHYRIVHHAIDL